MKNKDMVFEIDQSKFVLWNEHEIKSLLQCKIYCNWGHGRQSWPIGLPENSKT